ncbi:Dihydrolipoyllysine-residue acetyltransferase component of pyruvate dehydrogenase complex [Paenibacillus solanacearum]|uniref:Dihydrolipoamide acetyltransferase component of pyruvate dehydrogenase complex n=1 Tax=Paenibacillus solanacearum TaxID=2048548 RepID=A0A916JX60_9BACL|nr:dihydrolipoamide acetyltransferase family protein [Paenibacillus solanacearum]CAG7612241.1 Dihydrolipoyllysine-residue acetyltransferase component of pyruvate dehydrogenase complex [Paenibacillus solanacearum]
MGETTGGTEVTVPHLAESLVSATVAKWLRQPGDYVEQYDVLCELITDKVTVEMPSPVEGRIMRLLVEEGTTAAVGEAICIIAEPQAEAKTSGAPAGDAVESVSAEGPAVTTGGPMQGRYSPAVLKLAADHGVTLSKVKGTGLGGRITRKDVEQYIAAGPGQDKGAVASQQPVDEVNRIASAAAAEQGVFVSAPPKVPVRSTGIHLSQNPPLPNIEVIGQPLEGRGEYLMDVTPMRNAIARNMRQSKTEIPHGWMMIEVDVTNLVLLRNKLKGEFMKQEGINLTYLAFLLKAVVNAIKDYPIINSVWAVDKIIVKRDINISLAVGTEDSLVTPVIKNADQKNIAGLALEIDKYSRKARAGKLTLDDLQGGTFTVNNTGSFGSILSYPIINYPQAAILTFESIVKKPVVIQDMIAVRSMANLCLSLDHRILDGVICGRFMQRVKENLEAYNQDTKLY